LQGGVFSRRRFSKAKYAVTFRAASFYGMTFFLFKFLSNPDFPGKKQYAQFIYMSCHFYSFVI